MSKTPDQTSASAGFSYKQPLRSERGRIVAETPDGKWLLEIEYDQQIDERVDVHSHIHQRDVRIRDMIVGVICTEIANVRSE